MSTKVPSASLYVGDLHQDVTETILFEIFNQVGGVASIRVCRDNYKPHRSLGYAYVNFHTPQAAELALDTLNNQNILGRPCRIMWSQRDPTLRKSGLGNIYIKNLPETIDHKNLYDTFSKFGNILSCKVAMDETGKSRGFGFVQFQDENEAKSAIAAVNNQVLGGKKVFVGPFLPKRERQKIIDQSWTNVYVKNLDLTITEKDLEARFSSFGKITSVAIGREKNGTSRGFGFVNFQDHANALKAVEALQDSQILNKPIWCGRHQKKIEREAENRRKFQLFKQNRNSQSQGTNLYIKNLEEEVDEARLKREFGRFGAIRSLKIMLDEKGSSKGFGFINFTTSEEASAAISTMNGVVLQGCRKPLYVNYHEPKEIRRAKLAQQFSSKGRRHVPGPVSYYNGGIPAGPNYGYPVGMRARTPTWPHYAAAPYPVPLVPAGHPSGGRTSNRPGAGGRGRGVPSHARRHPEEAQVDANLAQLLSLPEDQRRLYLGEQLYPHIHDMEPILSGKITGMLLDSGWSLENLCLLLSNRPLLAEKVREAKEVLERAQQAGELEGDGGQNDQ